MTQVQLINQTAEDTNNDCKDKKQGEVALD